MESRTDGIHMPILYCDDDVCVVDKPAGVFVHPHRSDRGAPDCIAYLKLTLDRFIHTIHRIDRPTSGAVLFAFNHEAASEVSRQFREGTVEKRYIALVRGHLTDATVVDQPIPRDKQGEPVRAVSTVRPIAQAIYPAPVGRYSEGWFSLVAVELETGRYHQVRRHLRSLGHPIIGDTTHGDTAQNEFFRSHVGESRLFLRAHRLSFALPRTGDELKINSGLPDWWVTTLNFLGFDTIDHSLREPETICFPSRTQPL